MNVTGDRMPTYEYKCKKCDYHFEEFQSITSSPLTDCPKCDGEVIRIISGGAGFLFKGDGFYITENRSEKYKEAAKKDDTASPTPKESKTDTAPKAETKKETVKEPVKPKTESPKK